MTNTFHSGFEHNPLEFVVEPWLSPSTVLRVYRAVQQKIYGRKSAFLSMKNMALFEFVMNHFKPGDKFTWEKARLPWNRRYKKEKWKYEDYRHLRRDFLRTWTAITRPLRNHRGKTRST